MDATMRKAVTSVTDLVFPPKKYSKELHHQELLHKANDYVSSLPLQMCFFFNSFFFFFWLVSCVVMLEVKFSDLSTLYQIVLISVYIVMTLVEVIRLYIGYVGNLMEKVPELAGSWLLTCLLTLPLTLFLLLNEAALILPLERAVHIVLTSFVALEIILGFFAIKSMIDSQVQKFHLQQFTDLQAAGENDLVEGYDNRYMNNMHTD